MFWLIVWGIIAFGMVGLIAWYFNDIFQKKAGWSALAKKYNLAFHDIGFLKFPSVEGKIGQFDVSLYVMYEVSPVDGTKTVWTHLELAMNHRPPARFLLAQGRMDNLAVDMAITAPITPEHPDWKPVRVSMCSDPEPLKSYFSKELMDVLTKFFGNDDLPEKSYGFISEKPFLLLRTTRSYNHPKELIKLLNPMLEAAREIEKVKGGLSQTGISDEKTNP